jgi:transposase
MVHAHGHGAQRLAEFTRGVPPEQLIAVAIDVGKNTAMAMACDFAWQVLVPPFTFEMNRDGVAKIIDRVTAALPARVTLIRVGIETAGHYHRPLTTPGALPERWQVVELNPAHVALQRRANGARAVKTDQMDLVTICDMIVAGRGWLVRPPSTALTWLTAWVAHRRRRVDARTATKNQLQTQVDRAFPGLAGALHSVLDTKVGRLVIAEFSDPGRLARMGATRFCAFAAHRGIRVQTKVAERLVAAAKAALPTADAEVARQVLAADLGLLADLDAQIAQVDARIGALLPATAYAVLITVPGWGVLRAAAYGAALGEPSRWPAASQVYRAAGLTPALYESAGRRRDGGISREGSVWLRRAIIDLGVGLWHCEPTAKAYARRLRERGKPGGVIACALAHRANRIAFAMVRDQAVYDPTRWS